MLFNTLIAFTVSIAVATQSVLGADPPTPFVKFCTEAKCKGECKSVDVSKLVEGKCTSAGVSFLSARLDVPKGAHFPHEVLLGRGNCSQGTLHAIKRANHCVDVGKTPDADFILHPKSKKTGGLE